MLINCCHPALVCCTPCEFCVVTASHQHHCKMYSAQLSSRKSCTVPQPGLASVQRLTGCASTGFSTAVKELVSVLQICPQSRSSIAMLTADDALFETIMTNYAHILQPYLPERHELTYNLRERSHNRTLITKTVNLADRDFLLYKFSC